MKLVVIGASGFVGSYILSAALEKGYPTLGTRFSSTNRQNMLQFDLVSQRITDVIPEGFLKKDEPVYAVVCAANCKINQCCLKRNETYTINVTKTIELLEDLNQAGVKFVFLSTEFVYDGARGYYDESIPPCPINEYGKQKVEVEKYIVSHLPDNLILRLSKVVSDEPSDVQFFADIYHKLVSNAPIECIKGQVFSPTDVKDVANAIFCALELGLVGLYHAANPELFPREELARQFLLALNMEAEIFVKPVEEFGFPEGRPMKTYLDSNKFIKATGMHFTSMKEVMRRFAGKINLVR